MEQDYQRYANAQRQVDAAQVVRDLYDAQAGRETGRQRRLSPESVDNEDSREKKRREAALRETITLSWLLANDPEYVRLRNDVLASLVRQEQLTENTLEALHQDAAATDAAIDKILDQAARTEGGMFVFKTQDGSVVDQHGNSITDSAILDGIEWTGREPLYETYEVQAKRREHIGQHIYEWQVYQVDVLGHTRDRVHDETNPALHDELRDLHEKIREQQPILVKPTQPISAVSYSDAAPNLLTPSI